MAQQNLDFGTSAPNDGEIAENAFEKIEAMFGELYDAMGLPGRIMAGGVIDTLVTDDSSSSARAANLSTINDAFTYALNNGIKEVVANSGTVWCDEGLALGVGGADQKSLHFKGRGGGAVESQNTVFRFPDVAAVALNVGNGQFMQVSDLAIVANLAPTSRAALTGVGIGFNHGTHQIRCTNVRVAGFATCYKTGYNGDVLCDSTTFDKCSAIGNVGWHFSQPQNYINALRDCVGTCKIGVLSDVGKAVSIHGGNFSVTDAKSTSFTIGSISTLTSFSDSFAGSTFTNWTFTTTLSGHDQPMLDGAYDAFAIKTTGFGVIPLVLTNYNSGTKVATLKFYVGWLTAHYSDVDVKANTDITTELQAATKLYACEMVIPFYGTGIKAENVHVENPEVLTRLITTETGFTGDRISKIVAYLNHDINHVTIAAGTDAQKAVFYCQQVFPFVRMVQAGIVLEDCLFSGGNVTLGTDGVNIEAIGNTSAHRLISRNTNFYNPNITVPLYGTVGDVSLVASMATGAGEWDSTPFLAASNANQFYAQPRLNAVQFRGWRPDPAETPRLTDTQLIDIEDGLGAVGSYPPLCGDAVYSVLDGDTLFARSKHTLWSYGQNLSINWSYKGQTNILMVDDTTDLFAGLRITIDNGGGDQSYTITGIYPTLGYVTVFGVLAGTKTTTYNGATIKQAVYDIIKVAGV